MAREIRVPDLKKIKITDPLFGFYTAKVASTMLPLQWDILSGRRNDDEFQCYCIDNFRIAAGEMDGEHKGVVFCDTDAYKWIQAVAYCANNGETQFIPVADELIELIGRAQQADGYLNTYYTVAYPDLRWRNLVDGHELYGAGHLIEAATAYYEATGKHRLLDIACRFADLIADVFGPGEGQLKGYPGHQEIELALCKLWQVTGERRYLELAAFFINQRGSEPNYLVEEVKARQGKLLFPEFSDYDPKYSQSHIPPERQSTAEGHAVRAMYMYSAMADLSAELDDEKLKLACRRLWENITTRRMYLTGGIGSSGFLERFTVDYDLPNDRMNCESCASIGLMMFGQRMAALNKDASYYEIAERALHNTVLAGISAAGDRYFYVNPLEVWPDNCISHTSIAHVKSVRQPWFDVACCPPNIARTLASLGQYIYAEDDKRLYINQFISSDIETVIQNTHMKVKMKNELFSGGKLNVEICSSGEAAATVLLRVPSWLEQPVFLADGVEIHPEIENGYAVLIADHEGEHTFEVDGLVSARFVAANLNVRSDVGKLALMKGPYVYCFEQVDNGANLAAIRVDPGAHISEGPAMQTLPGKLPVLMLQGERIVSTVDRPDILYSEPKLSLEKTELTAVPYCLWSNRSPGEMRVWIDARL